MTLIKMFPTKKRYKTFLFFFLLANLNAIINTLVIITSQLADGNKIKYAHYVVYEFSGSYSFFLLLPLMLLLIDKLPFTKANFLKCFVIYFLSIAAFGIIHTAIMYYSRVVIFDFAGWGKYNYGDVLYRYPMETLKLFAGFVLVYFAYSFFISNRQKHEEKLKAVKLEEQLSKTRLEILKNQIHPHFLFNTLNMISSVMYENIQEADKMIASLSDLLRVTLKTSGTVTHSLRDEITILKYYLDIMLARFKDKLEIVFNIEEKYYNSLVPSFLFQPLVENSIKYGMETLSTVKIEIGTIEKDNNLIITIKDNGPGIRFENEDVLKRGVGLSNTQERLEKIYGNNFEFSWQNLDNSGLVVKIIIPNSRGESR
jgi:two-component system, LytTR family, sensor kinase